MPVYVSGVAPVLTYETATNGPEGMTGGATVSYEVPSFGTPPTDLEAITLQETAAGNFDDSGLPIGGSALGFFWDPSGGGPPWFTTLYAQAQRTPYVITPFNINPDDLSFGVVQPNGGIYWHPEYLPFEDRPEGYIGVEWLDTPGVPADLRVIPPTDVTVTLDVQGYNYDQTVDSPVAWTNHFMAQTGSGVEFTSDTDPSPPGDELVAWTVLGGTPFHETNSGEVGETLEVSLFDHLDDMHRCLIWARALPPGVAPIPPGDISVPATIAYGNTFNVSPQTWHYQPPPFRWILDSSPVLRHYPRDGDGRGWGGVVRHYPPPRGRRSYGGARQP